VFAEVGENEARSGERKVVEQGHAADTLLDGERLSTAGRSMIRLLDQTEE
jgi:hypothetical protein